MRPFYILTAAVLLSLNVVQAYLIASRLRSTRSADKDQTKLHASNANPVTVKKFCVNVNLYVKPERREEFLKVIAINSAGTLANEPLNISYTWGESTTEKNTFHFQEQFKGEEGFLAHTNMPHFATWKVFADAEDSPFWKPPVVFFFETL